ncbi:MAG TPA: hypothetical protein VFN49_09510 [Candidatus Aquilonibacter sp.]|nr:hypothetical protein [Candidatus Aquilonibacter sp.]
MHPLSRTMAALGALAVLCACGGGGGGSIFNPNPIAATPCNPGTSVTISQPQSGSYSVPTTIGSIEIVLAGNTNPVWSNPSGWTLALQAGYNGAILPVNGNLNPTSDPNGPHPYSSDFYLNESIPQLQSGMQYSVYLGQTYGGCTPVQIGQFNT